MADRDKQEEITRISGMKGKKAQKWYIIYRLSQEEC